MSRAAAESRWSYSRFEIGCQLAHLTTSILYALGGIVLRIPHDHDFDGNVCYALIPAMVRLSISSEIARGNYYPYEGILYGEQT
jgi:hypothetical protein